MTRLPADSERVTYVGGRGCTWEDPLEVHPSTTAVVVAATGPGRLLHRQVRDERFGRQDHRGDGGGVLERRAGDLGGIDDAGLEQVAVLATEGVVAVSGLEALDVGGDGLQEGRPTAGDEAFLDGRTGRREGILDAVLLLLELDLGGRADLDHGHAAGQLR